MVELKEEIQEHVHVASSRSGSATGNQAGTNLVRPAGQPKWDSSNRYLTLIYI